MTDPMIQMQMDDHIRAALREGTRVSSTQKAYTSARPCARTCPSATSPPPR